MMPDAIRWCDQNVSDVSRRYESVAADTAHGWLIDLLPNAPASGCRRGSRSPFQKRDPPGSGPLVKAIRVVRPKCALVSMWIYFSTKGEIIYLIYLAPSETRSEREMPIGTVKWFNATKGYGFIQPQDGGKDVFVHISAVERAGLGTLNEGQTVEYQEASNRGKTSAENLRVQR